VDGQLRLYLEAAGEDREGFHEAAREHPIAGKDIGEGAPEHVGDEAGQEPVAGAMAAAVSRLIAIDTGGDHHVQTLVDELGHHAGRTRRVVGRIAIDQHVDVRLDVAEHPPHHVALALIRLAANHGACPPRCFDGAVGGIVVVDVDGGIRQRRPEIGDDLGDGTRHQHRQLKLACSHAPGMRLVA
jgi:hypothetical protein